LIEWLAIGIGLAAGLLLSYRLGKAVLPSLLRSSRKPELLIKLSLGGTLIMALPALLLSIVVGATLGMPWGAPGIALGVAMVFAVVLLCGTFAGAMLARLLTRPGA
jgi:hypothetical protein